MVIFICSITSSGSLVLPSSIGSIASYDSSGLLISSARDAAVLSPVLPRFSRNFCMVEFAPTMVLSSLCISSIICCLFFVNAAYLLSSIRPISCPISVSLRSALSCLRRSLYSALDVIILYGSDVSFVTRSSIRTPIYACDLSRTTASLPCTFLAALIPAIIPWAAASSYPELPFIWPAPKSPDTLLNSREGFKLMAFIQSYSMA